MTLTFNAKKKVKKGGLRLAVRGLKSLLFRDGFDSRAEFLKRYEQRNVVANPHSTLCCSCMYIKCNHYNSPEQDRMLDEKSKEYLRATCAYCVLKIKEKCNDSSTCCLRMMRRGPWPTSLEAMWKFVKHCHHFAYERCLIDFILEGNPLENAQRHTEHYFNYIDKRQDLTSQHLLSCKALVKHHHHNDTVDMGHCGSEGGLLSNLCKPSDNGIRCVTCELQPTEDIGEKFINIRPKINEDHARKQIAKCVNVCVINNLSLRKMRLEKCTGIITFREKIRKSLGFCGINCNQRHNLSSGLSYLPIHFRTKFNDTAHWPRQNYERDHVSNVRGNECGCGKPWLPSGRLHNYEGQCGWLNVTGDIICSDYNLNVYEGINLITSYTDLVVVHACHCLPSNSLLKHACATNHFRGVSTLEVDGRFCGWNGAVCNSHCLMCVHYCSSLFTC